ncbi:MAG: ATP-binding protein [bacterium]
MIKPAARNNVKPIFIALLSFFIFILIIFKYTQFSQEKTEKDVRDNLLDILVSKRSQLEKALYSRIYYTKGVAAYCSINNGITTEKFYQLAAELIRKDTVISSMALSKDCIIGAIYPLAGHEAAIGVNLLKHPKRKKIVDSTILTHNTFLAGPLELVEGGVAFISYTPIFTKTKQDSVVFWGVTDIVILKKQLFNEIKLVTHDNNFKYALRGTDGNGKNGDCFWGDCNIFSNKPVSIDIVLPTGTWCFASTPINGWENYSDKTNRIILFLYVSAFIISLLIWQLSKAIVVIRENEKELKAIFASMQDIIIEFNKKGEYVKIAPTNDSLLILPPKDLLGKSVFDVFDKKTADYFFNAITECFTNKKMVVLDYPLNVNGNNLWFEARISYISENSVLYIARDNTIKIIANEQLKQSKQQLVELNETKDKFFSIIAHDLRSPFQGFLGISELLCTQLDTLSRTEIKDFSQDLNNALLKQYELLNDLLDWSRIQTQNFKLKKETVLIKTEVDRVFLQLKLTALQKEITLLNSTDDSIKADVDLNMLKLILRNLISNSLKFTNTNGFVEVSAKVKDKFVEITVSDNGVGIEENDLKKLFNNFRYSTQGTAEEVGTGLGLMLSKEIVVKHGGNIWAESEVGKGAKFIFTLPIR